MFINKNKSWILWLIKFSKIKEWSTYIEWKRFLDRWGDNAAIISVIVPETHKIMVVMPFLSSFKILCDVQWEKSAISLIPWDPNAEHLMSDQVWCYMMYVMSLTWSKNTDMMSFLSSLRTSCHTASHDTAFQSDMLLSLKWKQCYWNLKDTF